MENKGKCIFLAIVVKKLINGEGGMKMEIYVCMGTSCYIKGSTEVVDILKMRLRSFIDQEQVSIQLKGSFCLGPCIDGVVMKVGDKIFTKISPTNIKLRLKNEIYPYILEKIGADKI